MEIGPTELSGLDFSKICRICLLKLPNIRCLFETDALIHLQELTGVENVAKDDGLPQNICTECFLQLESCVKFKRKIESSDLALRDCLKSPKGFFPTNDDFSNDSASNKSSKRGKAQSNKDLQRALAELMASAPNPMKRGKNDCKDATCHVCSKQFSCKGQLTRHLKTHIGIRNYVCELCGNAYMESGALRKHFQAKHSGREKPHKCPECPKSFDLKTTLVRHIRTHTDERPFGCDVCSKFFPSKSYLNKHKRLLHSPGSGTKMFVCEVCSKSFASKDGLNAHLVVHSGKRSFRCDVCDKAFFFKGSLVSHIKYRHTKDKPFMCQICSQCFVTRSKLEEHIAHHNGQKREPRHECPVCHHKFHSTTHLKIHTRSKHTNERPYVCDLCAKSFTTAQSLTVHRRYHTGERPYSCKFCAKRFVTRDAEKVHERVHTGERPYKCSLCGSAFTQNSTLKTHMKCH